jgi:hypothetical protein
MCGIVGIDYDSISVEVYTIMWRATVSTYNLYNYKPSNIYRILYTCILS